MKLSFVPPAMRALATVLLSAVAAFGLLATTATAATQDATITLASPGVTPGSGSGFGVYNFTVAHSGPNAYPFATGAKRGHCVQASVSADSGAATLKTDGDATPASSPADVSRIAWLLESSLYQQATAGASSLTLAQRADAHQSAIWQITDPGLARVVSSDPAVAAESTRLLAASVTHQASSQQRASLAPQAAQTPCGPGLRGVEVKGAPFSTATLTITSANGIFSGGGKTASVDLGPRGTGTAQVSGGVGTVTISTTVTQSTLVHVDFATSQDFAYMQTTPVPLQANIEFPPCTATGAPGNDGPTASTPGAAITTSVANNTRARVTITARGAKKVRAGRRTTVTVKVTNTSKTIARNGVLTVRLPRGVVVARRTAGMTVRGRTISIRVGSLRPGRMVSRRIVVSVLRSTPTGRRCTTATIRSSNASTRRATTCMRVTGVKRVVIPAVTG